MNNRFIFRGVVAALLLLAASSCAADGPDGPGSAEAAREASVAAVTAVGALTPGSTVEFFATEFAFAPSTKIEASNPKAQVEASVRARYSNTRGFDGGQDGLVFDSIDEYDGAFTVRVRTARPLSKAQREALAGDEDETPLID